MLFEKHAIAIGIEAVSLLDRVPIGGQHRPSPAKGAHQHEQCRLWQVEVSEECPHKAEFVCWINEKTGFGSTCDHSPCFLRRMLERADGRGPDGHNPASGIEAAVDRVRSVRRDDIWLGVQLVILHAFDPHRLKRTYAYVQRNLGGYDSALPYAGKNFRSEVQTGGRGRNRASLARINGLISLAVFGIVRASDVWGQRHMPETFNQGEEIFGGTETDFPLAKLTAFYDFTADLPCIAEEQLLSNPDLPPRTDKAFPFVRLAGNLPGEKNFDPSLQKFPSGRIARAHRLRF